MPFGQASQWGSGRKITINEMLALLGQVVGEERFPLIRYAPPPPGEVLRHFVSIKRAEKYLDFSPATDLRTGLQKTWAWFKGKGAQPHSTE
jgi:UDP-glucose 4-epimerase